MALNNSEISDKIEQLTIDSDSLHTFVQGSKSATVLLNGTPTPTLSYFADKLASIENEAADSAAEAEESETAAKTSETNAKASETAAKTSETNAKASETAAKTSETNAKASETNASASAAAADASKIAAHDSALAAAQSAAQAEAAVPDNLVARVTDTEAKNTQQDGRLDAVEAKNTQQDTRLKDAEASLAGKLNANMSNRPAGSPYLVSTWTNGSIWCRKYSDGFIEQGGYLGVRAEGSLTVTFPIPFAGASYVLNVYAFYSETDSGHPKIEWRNSSGFCFRKTTTSVDTNWYAAGY